MLLRRFQKSWGHVQERHRPIDLLQRTHRARLAVTRPGAASLDDRTWDDLNLDAVFGVLDRTTSTLGQHALYHRLRSAPVANELSAFDALANRFMVNAPAREAAQLALAPLQDSTGYDLWWLSPPTAMNLPAVRRRRATRLRC